VGYLKYRVCTSGDLVCHPFPTTRLFLIRDLATRSRGFLQQASRFTDCARSWERAKHWLQTCNASHPACHHKIEPGNLPTRLVYVGRNLYDLRLYLSKDLPPTTRYLTLSHCWGLKPFLTLKRTNMEAFFKNIPFNRLSKTFKDAIISTRRLGFDYIWIDSLCIIQDDRVDWSIEAGTMGTVYANSSLNLGAIDSPDGDTGLFFWRPEKKILGWRVKLPLDQHQQGLPQNESVWDCVPARRRESFDNSVLSSRAWVFQERFLAPRNLYFGKDELSWECRTHRAYETSPFRHRFASQELKPANSALLNITNSTEQWFRLVRHYSKGELTVASDKLTALSGVAKLFALKSGKTYVAGLWKEDLLAQLLWQTDVPKNKTDIYRAPSWSWAAVDSQVYLLRDTRPTWGPQATVEQCFVEPSQSVFEDARGAYILLRTHGLKSCRIAKWKGKRGDWGWGQLGRYVIELPWLPPKARLYNWLTLDFKDADLKGEFYILRIMDGRGLVVKPTGRGTFVRVGCFRDWILEAPPDVEAESREMLEFVEAKKREWRKLTEGEREVLGESVGVDKHGIPLYVIKLL
jgi:hypothetical protein